ncbi:efflux RND transporter periplasmic adaptor subunit [Paenibacillus protaetiae]|uniref:HlyD family efflux transporter periplasmic adaptor subunit n=1 Tax=Paenibacillus protaetiae TaxID=2509456 RepID=A0A4P6EXW1_9BACL|nr:efflux RND transporter periplasmic adaptor subunit [Paenibacillus protaetiae]QAY67902.1 HlyD family efflux transporter periplasmic adaptor subunit [Paenibacillus protaetiae]
MNTRAILINIIVIVVILAAAGGGIYYYVETANYIKTDNAQVSGMQVSIAAPSAGELSSWSGEVGKKYNQGDTIGTVKSGTTTVDVKAPANGTIVQSTAVNHSIVGAGTSLAKSYDLNNLWITANIEETKINDIEVGQTVDVYVDAFPDETLTGRVEQIGLATAGSFSLLPTSNTDASYTKVVQVIPVRISIEGYSNLGIVPGMNATVRVHI